MVQDARVLSVDDEEFIAETIRRILSREEGIVYVGSLPSADQLVRGVKKTHATLVLMDLNMPGKDPFEAIVELRKSEPGIRIIILSGEVEVPLVLKAFEVGATGFISKDEPLDVIASAVRRAAVGERVLSPRIQKLVGSRIPL